MARNGLVRPHAECCKAPVRIQKVSLKVRLRHSPCGIHQPNFSRPPTPASHDRPRGPRVRNPTRVADGKESNVRSYFVSESGTARTSVARGDRSAVMGRSVLRSDSVRPDGQPERDHHRVGSCDLLRHVVRDCSCRPHGSAFPCATQNSQRSSTTVIALWFCRHTPFSVMSNGS